MIDKVILISYIMYRNNLLIFKERGGKGMIAKASKNKTCWLPAIKVDSLKMRRISPKSSFLGYINKSAAI